MRPHPQPLSPDGERGESKLDSGLRRNDKRGDGSIIVLYK